MRKPEIRDLGAWCWSCRR